MKITLITACYNSASVIRTAIESVLRQTWPDIEYLVVDGGSTDGTVEIIREYEPSFAGRMRWVSERDCGMYDAINKGIRRATGEVVGILNADDVMADDQVIERVAKAFVGKGNGGEVLTVIGKPVTVSREPSIVGVGPAAEDCEIRRESDGKKRFTFNRSRFTEIPDALYGDIRFVANRRDVALDEVRTEKTVRYYSARNWRPWMLQWGFMPPHPSVYIRRACFERLGDYTLDYSIAADYALLIRFFRQAQLSYRYVPMCFVDMRMGGKSTKSWRSNLLLNQEIVRGNREAGYFCCLPMLLPKYVFKIFEFVGPRIKRAFARRGLSKCSGPAYDAKS